jgi:hypothetical protein
VPRSARRRCPAAGPGIHRSGCSSPAPTDKPRSPGPIARRSGRRGRGTRHRDRGRARDRAARACRDSASNRGRTRDDSRAGGLAAPRRIRTPDPRSASHRRRPRDPGHRAAAASSGRRSCRRNGAGADRPGGEVRP